MFNKDNNSDDAWPDDKILDIQTADGILKCI